jgi:hypothetical protein
MHKLADAIIVICAVSSVALVITEDRKQAAAESTNAQEIAKLGKVNVNEKTLFMALSVRCHYCVEGIPLYKRLQESRSLREGRANLVALFPDDQITVDDFMAKHNRHFTTRANANISRAGVSGTPTFVLFSAGKIEIMKGFLSGSTANKLVEPFN